MQSKKEQINKKEKNKKKLGNNSLNKNIKNGRNLLQSGMTKKITKNLVDNKITITINKK